MDSDSFLLIQNVDAQNNHAILLGGFASVISQFQRTCNVAILDSNLHNNTADLQGGALYSHEDPNISIMRTNITNNTAGVTASAIAVYGSQRGLGRLAVTDSVIVAPVCDRIEGYNPVQVVAELIADVAVMGSVSAMVCMGGTGHSSTSASNITQVSFWQNENMVLVASTSILRQARWSVECTPCPVGNYAMASDTCKNVSATSTATSAASKGEAWSRPCRACPAGATCSGGTLVRSQEG